MEESSRERVLIEYLYERISQEFSSQMEKVYREQSESREAG